MKITKFIPLIVVTLLVITNVSTLHVNAVPDIIVPDDYSNIQAAIDNAQPYDEIWVRPGTYHETLDIDKPLTLSSDGSGEVIIDGLGDYQVIDIDANNVNLINLTVRNGSHGIYLSLSDYAVIDNCTIYNCTYNGISGYNSYDIWIVDTIISNCQDGVSLTTCDKAWITSVISRENTFDGISIYDSDNIWIKFTECSSNLWNGLYLDHVKDSIIEDSWFNNNDYGILVSYSKDVSICESESKWNSRGIYFSRSTDCYTSKTEMSHNEIGFNPWYSDAVIVNSFITDNTDTGVDSWRSTIDLRYCDISANNYGVDEYLSIIDAVNCWWGDPSGPYNPTYNPAGTGNQVDEIIFNPWQTTEYHPTVLLSDLKCQTFTCNWMAIYPTENTEKPLDAAPAMVSDWLSSAYVTTKLDTYNEGTDVNPQFVNQTSGENMAPPGECVLSFGGPIVNPIVKYAEQDTTPINDRAPLEYYAESETNYFRHNDGTPIQDANLPNSVINNDQDMFLIERYTDNKSRNMMLCYGFGWQGTYAAGKYFDTIIAPNFHDYYHEWIIVKWEDTNLDGFVNTPFDGDTYTVIATS